MIPIAIALGILITHQEIELRGGKLNWVSKPAALDELSKVFGFKDVSKDLLARKEWDAKITAEVTWVPRFGDFAARRAVLFKGLDSGGRLVFCLVAARYMKGDGDRNIAQFIEHQGYFALPTQSRERAVYRNYVMHSSIRPLSDRPGRWGILLEVYQGTPWATGAFVTAAFRAFGEQSPFLPSEGAAGLLIPSPEKWKSYSCSPLRIRVLQAEEPTAVYDALQTMKPSIARVGGEEETTLIISILVHQVWKLPDGTRIIYYLNGKPQGWPDMRRG